MLWDVDPTSQSWDQIKSRQHDGNYVQAGTAVGSVPTLNVCEDDASGAPEQQFDLDPAKLEVKYEDYEDVRPDKMYWRPDGMAMEYLVGPARVSICKEKFVAANNVILTVMYTDMPNYPVDKKELLEGHKDIWYFDPKYCTGS